jgi:hypothetical protein
MLVERESNLRAFGAVYNSGCDDGVAFCLLMRQWQEQRGPMANITRRLHPRTHDMDTRPLEKERSVGEKSLLHGSPVHIPEVEASALTLALESAIEVVARRTCTCHERAS